MFLVPSCAILFWMSRRSCSVTQNSMRIGLVRSAIGYSPPQTTTDNFLRIGGGHSKKYPLSYFNGQFRAKTWYLLRKNFSLTLQRTFYSQISGYDRQKILIRKSPHFTTDSFLLFVRDFSKNPKDHSYFTTDKFLRIGGISKNLFNLQRTFPP